VQCPDCGKETQELYEGSCADCAARRLDFVTAPETLSVVSCAHCGRVEQGAHWVVAGDSPDQILLDRLRRSVETSDALEEVHVDFDIVPQDERHFAVEARVTGGFHGARVLRAKRILVSVRRGVCTDCSRRHGGYFEATIQVRGDPARPLEDVEAVEDEAARRMLRYEREHREGAFFSFVERTRGGVDFRIGSQEVGRMLARELADAWGAQTSESAKLVGRSDDGRDVYRVTILIRLPAYRTGDLVRAEGRVCKVLETGRRTVRLLDLQTWDELRRDPRRVDDLETLATAQEERSAVVVSHAGVRLQVMDPVSYRTVDLSVPEGFRPGEEVRVFRHDERLWLVPDLAQARQ
jgi:nonsense-mediated mRNA decay protein 3